MAHVLECSNGHRWGSQISELASGNTGQLPVCGAAALVPYGADLPTSPSLNLPEPDESSGESSTRATR